VMRIARRIHRSSELGLLQCASVLLACVLGGFNRSSQHLTHGGVYGTTREVDAEVDRARGNALTGCAVASA
jgi:hypothetical protein